MRAVHGVTPRQVRVVVGEPVVGGGGAVGGFGPRGVQRAVAVADGEGEEVVGRHAGVGVGEWVRAGAGACERERGEEGGGREEEEEEMHFPFFDGFGESMCVWCVVCTFSYSFPP